MGGRAINNNYKNKFNNSIPSLKVRKKISATFLLFQFNTQSYNIPSNFSRKFSTAIPHNNHNKKKSQLSISVAENVSQQMNDNHKASFKTSPFPLNIYKNFLLYAQKIFFPVGYPTSVSQDYAKFQIMNNLQHYSNSICFVLGTQALLSSVGLSSGVALGGSAAINWVLKDGLGAIGTVILASRKAVSKNIDNNPKHSMLIGSLLFYIGSALEMVTPYYPPLFIVFASISNTFKSLGGLMLGSCKAIVNKNFANNQNLADVTAKSQSQSVAAHLGGVGTGILLSLFCQSYDLSVWIPYLLSSSFYLLFSYQQVKEISFRSLNGNRSFLLLQKYFEEKKVLNPIELSSYEKFPFKLFNFKQSIRSKKSNYDREQIAIRLNVSTEMVNKYSEDDLLFVQKVYYGQRYFVICKEKEIWVSFYKDISNLDQLQAIFNAIFIQKEIEKIMENDQEFLITEKYVNDLIEIKFAEILSDFWAFLREIQTGGWLLNEISLSSLLESETRVSLVVHELDHPSDHSSHPSSSSSHSSTHSPPHSSSFSHSSPSHPFHPPPPSY